MKPSYIFLFGLFFCGCDAFHRAPPADPYNPSSPPIQGTTYTADNQNIPPSSFSSFPNQRDNVWGVVKCHENQQELFNTELGRFLSSTIDPRNIFPVNCSGREDLKGGMWIKGKVNFENNAVFDPQSTSQQLDVSSNSYLEIHAVGINNKPILNIKMNAVPFGGSVQGGFITLAFKDKRGKVYLDGTTENGIFSGAFKYENSTTWQGGSQGYSGQVGYFSIPACGLLNCGQKQSY